MIRQTDRHTDRPCLVSGAVQGSRFRSGAPVLNTHAMASSRLLSSHDISGLCCFVIGGEAHVTFLNRLVLSYDTILFLTIAPPPPPPHPARVVGRNSASFIPMTGMCGVFCVSSTAMLIEYTMPHPPHRTAPCFCPARPAPPPQLHPDLPWRAGLGSPLQLR